MTEPKLKALPTNPAASKVQTALFWTCMSVIALVPLVFTTSVYRIFVLPKFSILIVGSGLILVLFGAAVAGSTDGLRALKSKHVALAFLYVGASAISTLFAVSPLASLFGSFQAEMGLISRFCFLVCFIGLIVAVSRDERRLAIAAWVIAGTGLLTAVYAFLQFFGSDPFLPLSAYTEKSPGGPVVRAIGTLGHSNYLGNFLLYTAPLTASLALAWRGRARRVAVVAVTFSAAAVAFSGTRGAWIGLLVGAAAIVLLEVRMPKLKGAKENRRRIIVAAIACASVLVFALLISSSPASRDVATRAGSFVEDRFTGSGRILLWRDALKMVPRFALVGCGPEAFSREFLAFKSFELARSAPRINNENPHNSYLDAAISFGIPGAILYAALIASAFSLLLKARRRAADRRIALISSGLLASLAAVMVHNLFIYDQVPTGVYFFAFNALALGAWNIARGRRQAGADEPAAGSTGARWTGLAVASAGAVLLVAATWFAVSLVMADLAIKRAMLSASAGDFESLVTYGERATSSLDPTGAYNLQFARALALYADKLAKKEGAGSTPGEANGKMEDSRARSLEMAIDQGQRSLAHTLTPDANYSLLAYVALGKGDTQNLRNYASKAISWDPNYFNARWLMAEALLAEGNSKGAEIEAEMALRLAPASSEARSVLARARGEAQFVSPRIQGLVERARIALERGKFDKTVDLLERAIRDSRVPCPECHRALALAYEAGGRYKDAIAEWETYGRQAPSQEVLSRIEALRKK